MTEDDLRPLLREWEAPEPASAMDTRIRVAWRASVTPTPRGLGYWFTARVSVPVPILAALVLAILALLIELRPVPPVVRPQPGYVTRLGAAGFQPLPDGAARAVPMSEVKQ
ncbi:hypothetical protein SBA3_520036 [Candidatus Sulfopaludibacter sp. SbA3]|nr:hypothetical protein SBA3_520036 [Candidatus Sulfopaludibacter sp. SbA3]